MIFMFCEDNDMLPLAKIIGQDGHDLLWLWSVMFSLLWLGHSMIRRTEACWRTRLTRLSQVMFTYVYHTCIIPTESQWVIQKLKSIKTCLLKWGNSAVWWNEFGCILLVQYSVYIAGVWEMTTYNLVNVYQTAWPPHCIRRVIFIVIVVSYLRTSVYKNLSHGLQDVCKGHMFKKVCTV